MPQNLTDDELLDVPLGNLTPGELARSFKVHAAHVQKAEEAETLRVAQRTERETSAEKQEEAEELHHREEVVLARLAEREAELREEAVRLDERTIKLDDGRRAYVDGDEFRDAEGHKLTGADRAQAEVLQVGMPGAATWQEKTDLDSRFLAIQQTRQQVEDMQAGKAGPNEAAMLSRIETQLQRGNASVTPGTVPDYSDTDYMGAISGLTAHPQAKTGPAL